MFMCVQGSFGGTTIRLQGVCSSAVVKEATEHVYASYDLLPSLLGEF